MKSIALFLFLSAFTASAESLMCKTGGKTPDSNETLELSSNKLCNNGSSLEIVKFHSGLTERVMNMEHETSRNISLEVDARKQRLENKHCVDEGTSLKIIRLACNG